MPPIDPALLAAWLGGQAASAALSWLLVHPHRRLPWYTGVAAQLFPVTWYGVILAADLWRSMPGPPWLPLAALGVLGVVMQLAAGWTGSWISRSLDLSEPEDH